MPTRLIDVGVAANILHQRFVLASENSIEPAYAAFSYCWGSYWHHSLTTDNLKEYLENIPDHCLPKTALHAVQVCRQLGIRYLWVDAFCIIQNSKSDWQTESVTMTQIYTHAALVIAALMSEHCDDGLYRLRNPLTYLPCKINKALDEDDSVFAEAILQYQRLFKLDRLPLQKAGLDIPRV